MSFEDVMPTMMRWGTDTWALAALGAQLAAQQPGVTLSPEVADALQEVLTAAGLTGLDEIPPPQQAMALGLIRMYLRQALELLEDPARPPGWTYTHPDIVDGWGRGSMAVPPMIAAAHPDLAGLASFLDVGTGVGLLAVAAAGVWPTATIVGIDTWEPSLERARANVAAAGLGDRIELRQEDLTAVGDVDAFDCVWIPTFFLSETDLEKGVAAAFTALRPGGWVVLGVMREAQDPLVQATSTLRTIRSGGTALGAARAVEVLEGAGCADVHSASPPGPAPMELILGQRPTT